MPIVIMEDKQYLLVSAIYAVASVITFLVYSTDKTAARKGRWRIPEATLHFLALIGGWPGALIAQQFLRHKTKKQPFRLIFWITVILNLAIVVWVLRHPLY